MSFLSCDISGLSRGSRESEEEVSQLHGQDTLQVGNQDPEAQ